jgi:hypothetical protein
MTVQTGEPDLQLIAIVGACIAASLFVLGWLVIGTAAFILEGDALSGEVFGGIIGFFLTAFAFGIVIALLTAFPLGWLYGRLILRVASPSIGMAALAGALTGVTLIGITSMFESGGYREMWQPASLFTGLGAVSGALAFHLIKRRDRRNISS